MSDPKPLTMDEARDLFAAIESSSIEDELDFDFIRAVRGGKLLRLKATLDAERARADAAERERDRYHDALIARHGGEPVALLRELDDARAEVARLRAALDESEESARRAEARVQRLVDGNRRMSEACASCGLRISHGCGCPALADGEDYGCTGCRSNPCICGKLAAGESKPRPCTHEAVESAIDSSHNPWARWDDEERPPIDSED